jgi:signal transduction histidine kinase
MSQLGGQLRVVFGLHHALLLEQAADAATLSVRGLDTGAVPDLVLRAQGNHLAAHALRYGVPQTLADASQAASVLDKQLLRWARAETMLAIPARMGAAGTVLLAFTERDHLKNLARDMPFLRRIVDLAASPTPAQVVQGRAEAQPEVIRAHLRQVVHEVNNPLGIIKNYMAILRVKLGDNPSIGEELRIIQEELDRVARITRQLVSEGRGEPSGEAVDVNLLLEDLIRVSEPGMMAHKHVRLEARLDPDLPSSHIDRDRTKQLLLNLLLNAIEASPPAATVSIETHQLIGMQRDNHLEVLISNTGNPIRADVLAQLFDPQDSSKGAGHAGLGLSIVRSLAQELGANVNCRSYNGCTTFQVLLPLI